MSNAVKFTEKGEVCLSISNTASAKYRFEVKDTGIGLTAIDQEKLFKSFSQADGSTTRKYGGTGLGLVISKQLVELMGGKIWIESKKDIGSSFIFEVNLEQGSNTDKQVVQTTVNIQDEICSLKGSNILLAEDSRTNQQLILGLLEDSGINIDIANNGQEAVELFKNKNYELIIMDLQMPVMGGLEAVKMIRMIDKNIPIIALTANAMVEDVEKTKQAGMQAHLNKPIEIEKFYATLLRYISKKQEAGEALLRHI